MIQDALNSISNYCVVPVFVEKERILIEKVGNARREAISVDLLISDENHFVDFKIISCMEEDYHEQGGISPNPKRGENTDENPLDLYKCASNETVLINTSHENEFIFIAPGEGSIPITFRHDLFCEELSHPHFFPYGKFEFLIKHQIPLSPTKYYNIVRKGVLPVLPFLRRPPPDPACPLPFLKFLFPLPSFLFHLLLRYFRQLPLPSCNPFQP